MVLECLLLQLVDILVNAQPVLFGISFDLLPLEGLELLWSHPAFLGFLGDLLLHGGDLLRRWLLIWGWGGRHFGMSMSMSMLMIGILLVLFLRRIVARK